MDHFGGGDQSLNCDERDGCRSLLCDSNGIIIAEMVYRCMRCSNVNDFMGDARKHYHDKHMEHNIGYNNSNCNLQPSIEYESVYAKESMLNGKSWGVNGNNSKLVDASNAKRRDTQSKVKGSSSAPTESCTRSGYITCPVCTSTRFYTTLQRRYGQFTCVACYRFFKEFFLNPTKYSCPNLGSCTLDVKAKCKGCWIYACINTYTVDEKRKTILEANRPYKCSLTDASSSTSSLSPPSTSSRNESLKSDISDTPATISRCNASDDFDLVDSKKRRSSDQMLPSNLGPSNSQRSSFQESNEVSLAEAAHNTSQTQTDCKNLSWEDDDMADDEEIEANEEMGGEEVREEEEEVDKNVAEDDFEDDENFIETFDDESACEGNPDLQNNDVISKPAQTKIKNWCCLQCTNCLAPDCGKCVNCLDRPKYGGPFVRKQRCVNKKCLFKLPK